MRAASTILEIPEVRARVSPLSVEDYHRLSEFNENSRRTELIHGVIIEKMSKSPLHSSVARRLLKLLQACLPPHFILLREDPLAFADSEPEPDLALVRGDDRDFADHHPSTAALVVEIAISSATEDRALATIYAEAGVEEYWIVLPVERRIEVYRRPQGGSYAEHISMERDVTLACGSVAGISVALSDLFA